MTTPTHQNNSDNERLWQLLADQATEGLDDATAAELHTLLEKEGWSDAETLDQAAAQIDLAYTLPTIEPMPTELEKKILADAQRFFGDQKTEPFTVPSTLTPKPASSTAWKMVAVLGWIAAAACLIILLNATGMFPWNNGKPNEMTPEQQRAQLLANASDVVITPWQPPDDPKYRNVQGDVVWSDSRQEGYLRLHGMPTNDPEKKQYQLWIVDPDRDQKHPVDGGVFDVASTSGDVIIPIQAKLQIRTPRLFAITLEQPGGVVVSAGPLLITAKLF